MLPQPQKSTLFPYTTLFRSLSTKRYLPPGEKARWRGPAPGLICTQGCSFGSNNLGRSEEHTSELQSRVDLVCRLLLEKKNMGEPRNSWQKELGNAQCEARCC